MAQLHSNRTGLDTRANFMHTDRRGFFQAVLAALVGGKAVAAIGGPSKYAEVGAWLSKGVTFPAKTTAVAVQAMSRASFPPPEHPNCRCTWVDC